MKPTAAQLAEAWRLVKWMASSRCPDYGDRHLWRAKVKAMRLTGHRRAPLPPRPVQCRMCDMVERTGTHVSKRQEQIHNAMHRPLRPQAKPKRKP